MGEQDTEFGRKETMVKLGGNREQTRGERFKIIGFGKTGIRGHFARERNFGRTVMGHEIDLPKTFGEDHNGMTTRKLKYWLLTLYI